MSGLDFLGELNRAEQEFVDASTYGKACVLGDGERPDPENKDREIRGELVRFFALGGSGELRTHEKGVELRGAIISGHFDLCGSDCDCDLVLNNCIFRRRPRMIGTKIRSLDLSGSMCPGFDAEGIETERGIRLGPGFHARGSVVLIRAKIGADLDCTGASIEVEEGDALNADGAQLSGSVFLIGARDDGAVRPFTCRGTLRIVSASVGDSVMVRDASFDSQDRKYALNLALVSMRRQLTLKRFHAFVGRLNLSGAKTYSLNDDPAEENAPKDLILNGFTYRHFSGQAPMDVESRLAWLGRQRPQDYGQDFWPQPYGQLAEVMRSMGHEADSRLVMMQRNTMAGRVSLQIAVKNRRWLRVLQVWIGDQFMRHVIGYGYRPHRSLYAMIVILAASTWFYDAAWQAGDMTPAAAPILASTGWQEALAAEPVHTAAHWGGTAYGQDYETFHPLAYAFDLFVPLIDLGQRGAWGPSTERTDLGRIGWWLRWVIEIVGWIVTALAAAAITGLVQRD